MPITALNHSITPVFEYPRLESSIVNFLITLQHEVNDISMNPTADWEKLGDRYYRKIQLYTAVFDQDLELENHIVTGAPYGGAIGMSFFFSIMLILTTCFQIVVL